MGFNINYCNKYDQKLTTTSVLDPPFLFFRHKQFSLCNWLVGPPLTKYIAETNLKKKVRNVGKTVFCGTDGFLCHCGGSRFQIHSNLTSKMLCTGIGSFLRCFLSFHSTQIKIKLRCVHWSKKNLKAYTWVTEKLRCF